MTSVAEFYSDAHTGLKFGVKNENHTTAMGHSGQDYNGWPQGTWIPNIAAGQVVRKVTDEQNPNDLGNYIVIECRINGTRYFITYCHLASFGGTPNVGETVQKEQGVGPIGNTGYSKGTHLHMMASAESMYPNSRVWLVDPLPLVLSCRSGTSGGDVTPIEPEDEDMPFYELINGPDGTVWWCVDRSLRYAIPDPKNLATYQQFLRDLGKSDAIVNKNASELNAYGAPVYSDWINRVAKAVDSVIEDEAIVEQGSEILAAVKAIPGGGGGGSSTYHLEIDIPQVPGKASGTATAQ